MSVVISLRNLKRWLGRLLGTLLFFTLVAGSTLQPLKPNQRVHMYTRDIEFNYISWTIDALFEKAEQIGVGATDYLPEGEATSFVRAYMDQLGKVMQIENQLALLASDENLADPQADAAELIHARDALRERLDRMQPVVEAILQEQVAVSIAEAGIEIGGVPFPPVNFHFTRPPMALILSPRDVIRQDADISLNPSITLEEVQTLETRVERELNVSALVVPIGGVGIYPTMVSESTSLAWITEVIAHEWVHNYLTIHPLGLRYYSSPELRTMNETTASILGSEFGLLTLEKYYPDLVPMPAAETSQEAQNEENPMAFDFRAEMRETRLKVDALLSQGRIEDAEAYMEARRQFLWENGYHIRRLNQAYFAFYGAYADEPGGAAGDDPVGDAVRSLWQVLASPSRFLTAMAWLTDFQDLQETLAEVSPQK
jgi:hypothetical protein